MIDFVLGQHRRDLGGFEVGHVLPQARARHVGPFVFFDEMGPVEFPTGIARSVDVRPHPHIGLSTLSYLFDGEIMHRDSVGSEQAIRPGEVNWMTAGSGVTHSERFERARLQGGRMHGLQAWIALPDGQEEVAPAFAHYDGYALPVVEDAGVWIRVAAGAAFGVRAPVATHSPLVYAHAELEPGAVVELPDGYAERAVYVARGEVEVDDRRFTAGAMVVFKPIAADAVRAVTPATLMLLGGEPVGTRHLEWNFVSSSRERIAQAKADWRAGRMKLPDLDHDEYIPLPPDPSPAPNPMS